MVLHSSFISRSGSLQDVATLFHLEKLKDLTCAQGYAVTVSNRFGVLDTLEDYKEIRWDTFKCETLKAAKECIREHPRSWSGFATVEMLDSIGMITLPDLLGTTTSTGLFHVGLELS